MQAICLICWIWFPKTVCLSRFVTVSSASQVTFCLFCHIIGWGQTSTALRRGQENGRLLNVLVVTSMLPSMAIDISTTPSMRDPP